MTDPFKHIEEASVVLTNKGFYVHGPVFVGPDDLLYTYWQHGYLRLMINRHTSARDEMVLHEHLTLPEGWTYHSTREGLKFISVAKAAEAGLNL